MDRIDRAWKVIKGVLGSKALTDINGEVLAQFVARRLAAGVKPGSVDRELAVISGMLGKAVEWGYVPKRPRIPFLDKPNGRTDVLSEQQLRDLLAWFRADNHLRWHFTPIALLAMTGARTSEILRLKWADCASGRMTFWETKNGEPRSLAITGEMQTVLDAAPKLGPYVCASPLYRVKPVPYSSLRGCFKRATKQLGLPSETCLHTLRHSAATRMLVEKGVDPRTVMQILGHKKMQMLQRYTHTNVEHLRSALETSLLAPESDSPPTSPARIPALANKSMTTGPRMPLQAPSTGN